MLLSSSCPGCLIVGPAPCPECVAGLSLLPSPVVPPALDALSSLFSYDGVGATMITRLKYRNHRDALRVLCRALAEQVRDLVDDDTVVSWVPTTRRRRRHRGFDQGELLARAMAQELDVAARRLLIRSGESPQTGTSRAERLDGPDLRVPASLWLGDRRVLLVDDVVTTGSTLATAAGVLRSQGAPSVSAATLAATPGHS